jgi:hypothetical protein
MGNRALVIFTDGERVSPVVYLHWCGDKVPAWLNDLKELMRGREGDVDYSCARFIGLCHSQIAGNQSLGVWNVPPPIERAVRAFPCTDRSREQLAAYGHGNAGVVIVNVRDYSWQACGGYLHRSNPSSTTNA